MTKHRYLTVAELSEYLHIHRTTIYRLLRLGQLPGFRVGSDWRFNVVLMEDQDRGLWNREMIAEGLALIDKAMRHKRPGLYQAQAAIAALHARAQRPEDTDWAQIDLLYAALEKMQPSPVITLNRAVAVSKVHGPAAALAMIEPLAPKLSGYFHFFGLKGGLLMQLGRSEEARIAFDQAIALANTAAEAAHIRMHLDRLMKDSAADGNAGARPSRR